MPKIVNKPSESARIMRSDGPKSDPSVPPNKGQSGAPKVNVPGESATIMRSREHSGEVHAE